MSNKKRESNKKQEKLVGTAAMQVLTGGKHLTNVTYPDEDKRNDEAVDMQADCDGRRFVLEHTRVEAFIKQIERNKQLLQLLGPLREELRDILPSDGGHFLLLLPAQARPKVKARQVDPVRGRIRNFVVRAAPSLAVGTPARARHGHADHVCRERITGLPFELELQRWAGGRPGALVLGRRAPHDEPLERDRRVRIAQALDAKLPKLAKARRSEGPGTASVLVLECDDIQLTDPMHVCDLVILQAAVRTDVPDHVVVVDTSIEDEWAVWTVAFEEQQMHGYETVDPAGLRLPGDSGTAGAA